VTRLLKLAILALLLPTTFVAQAAEGDWYVAPSVVYFDDDPDRKVDAGVSGGQVQFGKEMSQRFLLEGLLGYHDIDGFPAQEHLELGINALGKFRPGRRFSPYVIGGLGFLRADVGLPDFNGLPTAGTTSNSATVTGGLGLMARFGDSRWALRTEWRARHAFDDSLTDQIVSLGLQYTFGDSPAAAPMATAAAATAIPDPDDDGDGVPNARDVCPNTPAGTTVDAFGCAADEDRDGVPDDRDQCPGTWGVEVDENGCVPVRLRTVYFGVESAVLTAHARGKLDETVAILKRDTELQVDIAGHADSSGPEEFNRALSERRAEAVRQYLEQAGIDASRLSSRGYGESQPAGSNDTFVGRADNRRVELHAMGE
jgi:OOP family OmpA-OmpF porin